MSMDTGELAIGADAVIVAAVSVGSSFMIPEVRFDRETRDMGYY